MSNVSNNPFNVCDVCNEKIYAKQNNSSSGGYNRSEYGHHMRKCRKLELWKEFLKKIDEVPDENMELEDLYNHLLSTNNVDHNDKILIADFIEDDAMDLYEANDEIEEFDNFSVNSASVSSNSDVEDQEDLDTDSHVSYTDHEDLEDTGIDTDEVQENVENEDYYYDITHDFIDYHSFKGIVGTNNVDAETELLNGSLDGMKIQNRIFNDYENLHKLKIRCSVGEERPVSYRTCLILHNTMLQTNTPIAEADKWLDAFRSIVMENKEESSSCDKIVLPKSFRSLNDLLTKNVVASATSNHSDPHLSSNASGIFKMPSKPFRMDQICEERFSSHEYPEELEFRFLDVIDVIAEKLLNGNPEHFVCDPDTKATDQTGTSFCVKFC